VDLSDQSVGDAVVAVRVIRRHRRRADDDLCAVCPEHVLLVLADLVRADEDAFVAALLSDQRQTDAGVARGGLDNGSARAQLTAGLGGVDHLDGDPVLHAAAGTEIFDLRHDSARPLRDNRVQLDQRSVADQLADVLGNPHVSMIAAADSAR
jgi:hypothetical protein